MPNKLEQARNIINEVDAQMAELFVKRMRAAELVYEHKKEFGLPILDQKREDAVIQKNSALIEDEVLKGYYIDYLKDVMRISRAYQYRMQNGLKVAYSGVEGAFAHIAAGRIFPESNRISYRDFQSAYDSVVSGECDVAVLPIENSYAGEVGQTIDLIFSGELFINGIYELEVRQNLLGVPGAKLEDIKKVISHPQALAQCHDFIQMGGFDTEQASNTALAAKMVADAGDTTLGAIASVETAEIYGLKVLQTNINKSGENTTRFAVLSKVQASPPALSNSVLMFTVKHEAGSLANAISIIGKYGYNMTVLRSRPLKKYSWQYYFYLEIDGRIDTENGIAMMKELGKVCDQLKVAGTFSPHTEI
ncbi:MAG: chorismate mutase [Candidatus Fournierella pullistercoris]|uniref:Bifunctional chorismate mutase/prephenate dehydratase n=1 Tax=Candidatus Allofournierella pullistercoris TaxID=2838597 RepID=A0A948WQ21_9FIRM|nr:chorismate mutase [Candidatus Fournierella pullistercoris]